MSPLKLNGSTSGFVALDAPAAAGSNTLTLPTGNGSNGQALTTNGSGVLSFSTITSSQWTTSGSDINYTAGRVGIGTTPDATLHVYKAGDGQTPVHFQTGNANGHLYFYNDSNGYSIDSGGDLRFVTNRSGAGSPERMRIANNGRLSVGSNISDNGHWMTNPGSDTSVLRLRQSNNAAGVLGLYYDGQPNNANDRFLSCLDNNGGTARCHIQSNGGIANYQANNSNLSDARAKKDISPATDTWDCIKEWEIVNYRYKDQPDDADLNLGVIAQQVAEGCPEVVTVFQESKEATETEPAQEERLGVKEQQMMWMAIKALQEAQARIETLEANNAALEARLTALEVTP